MSTALAAGHDVALWPGGEVDSLRPWTKRDEAVLAGRTGFIRLAIKTGVPIVPIATVGGPGLDARASPRAGGLAKALQIDKLARIKIMPISLSAPWGLSPAMLPEIPLPTKIRTAFQEPIELDDDPDRAKRRRLRRREVRGSAGSRSRAAWTRWRDGAASRCSADRRESAPVEGSAQRRGTDRTVLLIGDDDLADETERALRGRGRRRRRA